MSDSASGGHPPGRGPRGGKRRNRRRGKGGQTPKPAAQANQLTKVENLPDETASKQENIATSVQEPKPTSEAEKITCASEVVETNPTNTTEAIDVKSMQIQEPADTEAVILRKTTGTNTDPPPPTEPPTIEPLSSGSTEATHNSGEMSSTQVVDGAAAAAAPEAKKSQTDQKKQSGKRKEQGKKEKPAPAAQGAEGAPAKSKAQLKAERRAVQEAQRAAKAANESGGGGKKKGPAAADGGQKKQKENKEQGQKSVAAEHRVPDKVKVDDPKAMKRLAKKLEKHQIPQRTVVQKKVGLFNHLHQYEREVSLTKDISFGPGAIHPAILRLGLQYAEGIICGSNARCVALLAALKQVISDYTTPPQKELSRDLDAKIKPCISFLNQCRPLSISMGNAIKKIKQDINGIREGTPDNEAKESLCEKIDEFYEVDIVGAGKTISQFASDKIRDGDVILTYACSSLIHRVLSHAHNAGKKFKVIVVDGRPKLEGREMLRKLIKAGIECSYVLINAASYVMKEVTKVMLGAHALLANGYVMSRVGSSQVALIAKAYNVPVLVCCETYKFCEKVQTDSFVYNELGDPDDLVQIPKPVAPLSDWRDMKSLNLLNLVYDVTPSEFVSMVITEIAVVPCTSVPVVLRLKHIQDM